MAFGAALAFVFVKIGGKSLLETIQNFLLYTAGPKLYLWKRGISPKIMVKKELAKEKIIEKTPLAPKAISESRLKKLATKIETKTE